MSRPDARAIGRAIARTRPRFEYLQSTPAKPTACSRCDAALLAALDEGVRARVDAEPIDPADEVNVLLDGRRTYTLTPGGWLYQREVDHIRSDKNRGQIHAEHKCTKNEETLF
jgi:hypothetical protein